MAIPNPGQLDRYIADRQRNYQREAIDLLGAWVSELEPALVAFLPGVLIGVTAADHCDGGVVLDDRIYVRLDRVHRRTLVSPEQRETSLSTKAPAHD